MIRTGIDKNIPRAIGAAKEKGLRQITRRENPVTAKDRSADLCVKAKLPSAINQEIISESTRSRLALIRHLRESRNPVTAARYDGTSIRLPHWH